MRRCHLDLRAGELGLQRLGHLIRQAAHNTVGVIDSLQE
jgi:hypothetical protein